MADRSRPVAIVIGALAPYTDVLYDRLAEALDRPVQVLACCARERDRSWTISPRGGYQFEVCAGAAWYRNSISTVYFNPKVLPRIARLKPSVVILNDFSPTMLMTAWGLRARGWPYGVRTDGRLETDPGRRSRAQGLFRRQIVSSAAFGLGPTQGSIDLLKSYGLRENRSFISPLFPAWTTDEEPPSQGDRPFDVMFCGSLNEEVKGASFFADVMVRCAELGRPPKVRVVGDGPLLETLRARFEATGIDARFDGFLPQDRLGAAYASAKLLLFPTRGDVWGVVVQEALQSGVCVIASPHSGAAEELLLAHQCGLVLPLERDAWAESVLNLLEQPGRRSDLVERSRACLTRFSLDGAVEAYRTALKPFVS